MSPMSEMRIASSMSAVSRWTVIIMRWPTSMKRPGGEKTNQKTFLNVILPGYILKSKLLIKAIKRAMAIILLCMRDYAMTKKCLVQGHYSGPWERFLDWGCLPTSKKKKKQTNKQTKCPHFQAGVLLVSRQDEKSRRKSQQNYCLLGTILNICLGSSTIPGGYCAHPLIFPGHPHLPRLPGARAPGITAVARGFQSPWSFPLSYMPAPHNTCPCIIIMQVYTGNISSLCHVLHSACQCVPYSGWRPDFIRGTVKWYQVWSYTTPYQAHL